MTFSGISRKIYFSRIFHDRGNAAILSVENRSSEDVKAFFFSLYLYPPNNPDREGLRLSTCGPPAEEVAHPWFIPKLLLLQ